MANYRGLLFGVFTYALERGEIGKHPLTRTAPKRSKIRQYQADLRFLTEPEFGIVARAASDDGDLLRVTVGTGLRYGELTALWVSDVDLRHRTIRVNKAWKRDGEDGEQDVPGWLNKQLRDKHTMRGHHLGNPKTPKSKRTIEISREVAAILRDRIAGKAPDDFIFVTPTGHGGPPGNTESEAGPPSISKRRDRARLSGGQHGLLAGRNQLSQVFGREAADPSQIAGELAGVQRVALMLRPKPLARHVSADPRPDGVRNRRVAARTAGGVELAVPPGQRGVELARLVQVVRVAELGRRVLDAV